MTDDAIAKRILELEPDHNGLGINLGELTVLAPYIAKAFLALSEKCRRYETAMREVPHENWCDTLNNLGKHCNCNISPIFEAIEPGDSDE